MKIPKILDMSLIAADEIIEKIRKWRVEGLDLETLQLRRDDYMGQVEIFSDMLARNFVLTALPQPEMQALRDALAAEVREIDLFISKQKEDQDGNRN